jgi:hypothetical protein
LSNAVAAAAGYYHSLAIRADGTVLAWGNNGNGQCNVPPGLSNAVAVSAGVYHSAALRADGTVLAWGDNGQGQCDVPAGLSNAVGVAAGGYHSFVIRDSDLLTVASAHGTPTPAVGTQAVPTRSSQTCSIELPVPGGTTQYVYTGWAGMGSVPASGVSTSVTFTITNDSAITWLWGTNVQFNRAAGANGDVIGDSNGWYALGCSVTVTAAPAPFYHFHLWSGDVSGSETNSNPLVLGMDRARSISAAFVEDLATNATPLWWLNQYGLPTNDAGALYEEGDGMPAWAEWIAGTDPTNMASVLRIVGVEPLFGASEFVVMWSSASGRLYAVQCTTNLGTLGFWSLTSGIPAVPPMNVWTDSVPFGVEPRFYRIKVSR